MKKEKTKIMIGFFKKMRFRSEQPYTLYIVLTHAIMFRGKKKKNLWKAMIQFVVSWDVIAV